MEDQEASVLNLLLKRYEEYKKNNVPSFGKTLKEWRKRIGKSQLEVSLMLFISPTTYGRWEKEEGLPKTIQELETCFANAGLSESEYIRLNEAWMCESIRLDLKRLNDKYPKGVEIE